MKKLLVLTSALLVLTASIASAQGINYAWKNCLGTGTGANIAAANLNYLCDESLAGIPQKLVLSFTSPASMNQFVGMQAVIDMQTAAPSLPDFWRLGVGECREGVFVFPSGFTGVGNTTCTNPYTAQTGGGYQWNSGVSNAARARLQLAFADANERVLVGGRHYIAGVGTLDLTMDLGFGECTGCLEPACIVVNELSLYQTAGAPGGDVFYLNGPATRNYVTWQGGAINNNPDNGCPSGTPAKKATWGGVKSLYR